MALSSSVTSESEMELGTVLAVPPMVNAFHESSTFGFVALVMSAFHENDPFTCTGVNYEGAVRLSVKG